MKGNSENMLSAVWNPKFAAVHISERTAPKPPLDNNSEKRNVYSTVTIQAGGTRNFDIDVNIGTEAKILHDRRTTKLFGYCLFICVCNAVMYGFIAFQLESRLTITNHRFNVLQQEVRWLASNYKQMKQKMFIMERSLDQLLNKHRYDESFNSEESPSREQFTGTDKEPLSQSAPYVLSYSEINSDGTERVQPTKSNEDNIPIVSGTSNQSGLMSSHNLILREYGETSNNHNKSVSVSDSVTSFQNVFNQSELQREVPFVDNIISLDTFSDYESASIEDFDQDKEDSTELPSRVKRSNRRGKNSGVKSSNKAGNRHHKKPKMRGPVAAHFKGGQIETVIRDGGLIAPWYPDEVATGDFGFSAYEFREGMGAVEVTENGLYLIYAQAYYLTTESLNSFSINIMSAGQPDTPVAFCSTSLSLMSADVTEASCFTSVVRFLNATTRVTLKQRERNRRMILREGYTFLGLVKLNSQQPNKGRRGN